MTVSLSFIVMNYVGILSRCLITQPIHWQLCCSTNQFTTTTWFGKCFIFIIFQWNYFPQIIIFYDTIAQKQRQSSLYLLCSFVGVSNRPAGLLPVPNTHRGAPDSPASGSSQPSYNALSRGSSDFSGPSYPGAAGGNVNVHLVLTPGGVAQSQPSQGELNRGYFSFIWACQLISVWIVTLFSKY